MDACKSPSQNNNGAEITAILHETQYAPLIRSENERRPENDICGAIRVVVQRPHERFFLLLVTLRASTTSRDVMQELREMKNQEVSRIKVLKSVRQSLWTTVIEVVSLSTFHLLDVEAQPSPRPLEVIVSSRTLSAELTAAFHRSWLLQSSVSFADQYPALLSSSSLHTALLIGQELNKCAIFWLLLAALLVILGVGLVVGFVFSRPDIAVAITGGLTGIVSVLTTLLIWMLK